MEYHAKTSFKTAKEAEDRMPWDSEWDAEEDEEGGEQQQAQQEQQQHGQQQQQQEQLPRAPSPPQEP